MIMIYIPCLSLNAPALLSVALRSLPFVLALCLVSSLSASSKAETWPSDSFYVRNDPNNDAVIIFVHGVTGNNRSTWTNDNGRFWPQMLKQDNGFNTTNIFVYGYDSPLLGESLTIGEVGENVKLILSANNILKHNKIIFLMHSMGGLIVRSFLTEYQREDWVSHIKLLYFLATPTEGSQLSQIFGLMSQNPQFSGMAPADRANKLGEEMRRWLAARFNIPSFCAYETVSTPSGVFGVPPVIIVSMPNALALCTQAIGIPKANHITISKPENPGAPQYLAFREALKESNLLSEEGDVGVSSFQRRHRFRHLVKLLANPRTQNFL
jgi:pimeloyl-ACP methyl ester carboxylesterase